jgi:hypothetical protein
MKGVNMIRIALRPHAYCLGDESEDECSFTCQGTPAVSPAAVRSEAQAHVKATGHDVIVDVIDRTHYGADGVS